MPSSASYESSGLLESIQSLITTVVIAVFVITFAVQAFQIPSESMEETLLIGDYLLVDKLHFGGIHDSAGLVPYRSVQRGDIVVFHYPINPAQHFVKRVIGVPKDRIRLVNKQVFLNDHGLEEPYKYNKTAYIDSYRDNFPGSPNVNLYQPALDMLNNSLEHGSVVVPPGHYFAMGDNRDYSLDSRYWGFVPRENILGRPLVLYWSMNLTREDYQASDFGHRVTGFIGTLVSLPQKTRRKRLFRTFPRPRCEPDKK